MPSFLHPYGLEGLKWSNCFLLVANHRAGRMLLLFSQPVKFIEPRKQQPEQEHLKMTLSEGGSSRPVERKCWARGCTQNLAPLCSSDASIPRSVPWSFWMPYQHSSTGLSKVLSFDSMASPLLPSPRMITKEMEDLGPSYMDLHALTISSSNCNIMKEHWAQEPNSAHPDSVQMMEWHCLLSSHPTLSALSMSAENLSAFTNTVLQRYQNK